MPLPAEILAAAERARDELNAGHSIIDALRAIREDPSIATIGCIAALRELEPIGLSLAMEIVDDPSRYAHIGLRELRHLVKAARCKGTFRWLERAILQGQPWLLFVPNGEKSVRYYFAEIADGPSDTSHGDGISMQRVRDDIVRAVEDPDIADEVRILRDEPDALLLYFPFVAR